MSVPSAIFLSLKNRLIENNEDIDNGIVTNR